MKWLFFALLLITNSDLAKAEDGANEISRGDYEEDLATSVKPSGVISPRTAVNRRPAAYGAYLVRRGERDSKARSTILPAGLQVRLAAATGISSISATDVAPGVSNVALNGTLDVRYLKYLGAEADVHGDLLAAKYSSSSTATPTSKTSRDYLFAVKGQLPFWLAHLRITPKLGGGYGYVATNYENSPATAGKGNTNTSSELTEMAGAFATLGVDVEVTRELIFFGDYARSVGAHGNTVVSGKVTSLTNATFDRIRVGGFYRLGENWGLGAQYVRRNATYDSPTAGVGQVGNLQSQFLGLVMFDL